MLSRVSHGEPPGKDVHQFDNPFLVQARSWSTAQDVISLNSAISCCEKCSPFGKIGFASDFQYQNGIKWLWNEDETADSLMKR